MQYSRIFSFFFRIQSVGDSFPRVNYIAMVVPIIILLDQEETIVPLLNSDVLDNKLALDESLHFELNFSHIFGMFGNEPSILP